MSEDAFLKQVVQLALLTGWMASHISKSARKVGERWVSSVVGDRGFPDLVLCRPPRLILAELKVGKRERNDKGHIAGGTYGLTADQKRWKVTLEAVPGVEFYVWTSDDMEAIAAELR